MLFVFPLMKLAFKIFIFLAFLYLFYYIYTEYIETLFTKNDKSKFTNKQFTKDFLNKFNKINNLHLFHKR